MNEEYNNENQGMTEAAPDVPPVPPVPPLTHHSAPGALEDTRANSKYLLALVLGFVGFGLVCLNVLLFHTVWLPIIGAVLGIVGLILGHKSFMDFKGVCMVALCVAAIGMGIYDMCWQVSSNLQTMLYESWYEYDSGYGNGPGSQKNGSWYEYGEDEEDGEYDEWEEFFSQFYGDENGSSDSSDSYFWN